MHSEKTKPGDDELAQKSLYFGRGARLTEKSAVLTDSSA